MKTFLFYLFLLAQGTAVISARAGLLTVADGRVNLQPREHVGAGNDLTTGRDSRAELLLNPDTYLRMGSDTTITLDSDSLEDIAVRLVKGPVVIDSMRLDEQLPITIRNGDVEVSITKDGLYFFETDRLTVLDGEVALLGSDTQLKKGSALIFSSGTVERIDVEEVQTDPLLRWSERRARQLSGPPNEPARNPAGRGRFRFPF